MEAVNAICWRSSFLVSFTNNKNNADKIGITIEERSKPLGRLMRTLRYIKAMYKKSTVDR